MMKAGAKVFKAGLCQLKTVRDKERNLKRASEMV